MQFLGDAYNFTTQFGLTGKTKCSYIIKCNVDKGAPAFSLTSIKGFSNF